MLYEYYHLSNLGDGGVLKRTVESGVGNPVMKGYFVKSRLFNTIVRVSSKFLRVMYKLLFSVHSAAYLDGVDAPFDSTRVRNKPQTFQLNDGDYVFMPDIYSC